MLGPLGFEVILTFSLRLSSPPELDVVAVLRANEPSPSGSQVMQSLDLESAVDRVNGVVARIRVHSALHNHLSQELKL